MTIPTLPRAVIPPEPTKPKLDLPPVLVLTAEETNYYREACESFESVGNQDGYATLEEAKADYPGLTRANACDWAVYGFTVQDWLTVESQMADIARYVDELRSYIHFLHELYESRQKVMDEQLNSLQNIQVQQAGKDKK